MAILRRRLTPTPVQASAPILRRSRPTPTPTAGLALQPPQPRLRSILPHAASRQAKEAAARAAIDEQLKLIANIDARIDEAVAEQEQAHAKIEALLRGANLRDHSDGVYKTGIEEQISKQSRTIDPKKFKNAVSDKDFWDCVSISVTKAKDVIGEKELNSIAEVVPAKSMGFVFKIKRVDKK